MRVRAGAAELRSTVPDEVPVIGAAELSGLDIEPLGELVAPLLGDVLIGDVVVLLFIVPAADESRIMADESAVVEPAAPPVTELRSVVSRASGSLVVDGVPEGDVVVDGVPEGDVVVDGEVDGDVVVDGGCVLGVDGSDGDVVGAPVVPGPLGDVVGCPPGVVVEPGVVWAEAAAAPNVSASAAPMVSERLRMVEFSWKGAAVGPTNGDVRCGGARPRHPGSPCSARAQAAAPQRPARSDRPAW
jgi:hypothetical protein